MAAPCGSCGSAAAPYTCPRCQLRVCSVRCYRAHGACAEAFYRRQVLQALEAERGSPAGRDRLASAFRRLQRLREAEASAGPTEDELWASLRPAERDDFLRLLDSGQAAALLPPWTPWWRRRRGPDEAEAPAPLPPGPAPPLPALSSLPAPPPSPLLPFQLPNVLYGYAFALSLHHGDESLLPELPAAAVAVSAALRTRCPFSSTAEALEAARRDAEAAGLPLCPLGPAGTALAVAELLEGGVEAALGHLERLLRAGARCAAPGIRESFGRARRKCRFLRAWSAGEAGDVAAAMAREARRVHGEMREEGNGGERPGRGSPVDNGGAVMDNGGQW
ncbi:zinc finger HIT domain-containing protein 2 [Pezoporus wallicus]|uniref:zinc finger HIT domain-containing protein 2 n=1 Tax=Pezoporus wallicus TaxID=35540 RepID=UPI00254D7B62|nr:zinc finger HIT domain-containing protein 2 [Pezoporus wallicus]